MRILAIISGEYGARHVANLRRHGSSDWRIEVWKAPSVLPMVIDYPEEYLPEQMPPADLVLSLAEHSGVAELIPDTVRLSGARAVIAAVDNEAWLPRGLARQLRGWLERMGVACATPKPLCSLTETDYGLSRRQRLPHESPVIAAFARFFGQPALRLSVDPDTRRITHVEVVRDAVCGCAHFVAEGLIGATAEEAEEKAGLRHHHYPCLASMGIDVDFGDTLMHVSGNLMRDEVGREVKPHRRIERITPGTRSEE